MSGPLGVGGFEEGEFEGDGPTEEVAAQVRLCGADPVRVSAQPDEDGGAPLGLAPGLGGLRRSRYRGEVEAPAPVRCRHRSADSLLDAEH